jgi:hypothetical protein
LGSSASTSQWEQVRGLTRKHFWSGVREWEGGDWNEKLVEDTMNHSLSPKPSDLSSVIHFTHLDHISEFLITCFLIYKMEIIVLACRDSNIE